MKSNLNVADKHIGEMTRNAYCIKFSLIMCAFVLGLADIVVLFVKVSKWFK